MQTTRGWRIDVYSSKVNFMFYTRNPLFMFLHSQKEAASSSISSIKEVGRESKQCIGIVGNFCAFYGHDRQQWYTRRPNQIAINVLIARKLKFMFG
jgi:hypothetical protein